MRKCQNIDWESTWKEACLQCICGFANAQGGKLFIGLDETGKVIGVRDAQKLLEEIIDTVQNDLDILVNVNILTEDGKDYIEIAVQKYCLVHYNGIFYMRSGSTTLKMSAMDLNRLLAERGHSLHWDCMVHPTFSMEDIDEKAMEYFIQKANRAGRAGKFVSTLEGKSREALMQRLLLNHGSHLMNAAALLFSKDPEQWVTGAYIKVGYFESGADLLFQDEVHGSLPEQIDNTMELLLHRGYLKAKISYEKAQRIERYIVPVEALREAVTNAVFHKRYQSGIPIQIRVYKDKISITNTGIFPDEINMDQLKNLQKVYPSNPAVATLLYIAGYGTWGRGIEKIFSACEEDGVPQPEYIVANGVVCVQFRAPADRIIQISYPKTDPVLNLLTRGELEIVKLIKENPRYTAVQMSAILKKSKKTVFARIKMLKEKGILMRCGSRKTGYWQLLR